MKDLYTKNDKTLMEEIEETNKQKNMLCTWIRRINIIKMSLLPKSHLSIDSVQFVSKFPWHISQK